MENENTFLSLIQCSPFLPLPAETQNFENYFLGKKRGRCLNMLNAVLRPGAVLVKQTWTKLNSS